MINQRSVVVLLSTVLAVSYAKPGEGYSYQQPQQQLPISASQINYQQPLQQIPQQVIYSPNKQTVQTSIPSQQSTSFLQSSPIPQQVTLSQSNIQIPLSNQKPTVYLPSSPLPQQATFSQSSHGIQNILTNQPSTSYISQPATINQQAIQKQPLTNYIPSSQVPQFTLSETSSSQTQDGLTYQQIPQLTTQFLQLIPQLNPNVNPQSLYPIQSQLPQIPQSSTSDGPQQVFLSQPQFVPQLPLITKHIYVHVAPEEPPLPPQIISTPPPKKTYKIIFIKAPSAAAQRPVIHLPAAQPATEEKTLVYVLVDKPQQPQIVVPAPAAAATSSKPEVYFVKYKANPKPVLSTATSSVATASLAPAPQQSINTGESTSSLFSGGLSTKYGPPGYQKRET